MFGVCMHAYHMRSFYKDSTNKYILLYLYICKEQLGILSDESLETMLWSEVVSRLVQRQKEARVCILQEELTALEITNVIMRQEICRSCSTSFHLTSSTSLACNLSHLYRYILDII